MSRVLSIGSRAPRPIRRLLRRSALVWRLRDRLAGRPRGPAPTPGGLRPVVCLPTWLPWARMRQRPHALLAAFASAGHPAFFVDPTVAIAFDDAGVSVVPGLAETPRGHVILYAHFAPSRSLAHRFSDAVVVYDVLDDASIYEAGEVGLPPERRVGRHHVALLAEADLVMAASPVLAERIGPHRPDVVLVENGVDADHFGEPRPRPEDLPPTGPLVGYHGAVAPWVDADLVAAAATARPQWHFVFVGPVVDGAAAVAERLAALPNVTVLGERPFEQMPAYVQAFDVGIVPFLIDRLTEAVSPLKLFEYLAAGRPVVSTPLPACVGRGGVRVAQTSEEFVAAIEAALGDRGAGFEAAAAAEVEAAGWGRRLAPALERLDALGRRRVPL